MDSRRYRSIVASMQPEATAQLVLLDSREAAVARKQLDFQVWLGDLAEERVRRKVDRQYELVHKQMDEGLTAEESIELDRLSAELDTLFHGKYYDYLIEKYVAVVRA